MIGTPVKRKMKSLVALLTLAMLLPGPPAKAQTTFSDIDMQQKAWAVSSIYVMSEHQVLTGYPDGTFRPDETVTKAEWTQMIYKLFNTYRPNLTATGQQKVNSLSDVTAQHWAYKPISEIYNHSFQWGVFGMDPSGRLTFQPDTKLSRLELSNLLYSFFDTRLIDRRLSPNDVCSVVSQLNDFPVQIFKSKEEYDAAVKGDKRLESVNVQITTSNGVLPTFFMGTSVADCAFGTDGFSNAQASVLASLQASGIMTATTDGYFRPLDKVTRAEAVTILNRIYNFLKKNYWLPDYSNIDLEQANTVDQSNGGLRGSIGDSSNPYGGSSGGSTYSGSNPNAVKVKDYFKLQGPNNNQGSIAKNLRKDGEIETAISPQDYNYLSLELVSQDKAEMVDLYVTIDGKITLIKQEDMPTTIAVNGVQSVGLRTQLRNTSISIKKGGTVTLSVRLDKQNPTPVTDPASPIPTM
ncbi:S-layer homology domain-containing protein [Paenibacillus agricola]|uniref:S-layer homology domain-containing protein n=1 Tax=Paenibacillus agricola TaxID=2716264 RepID=A0ABX0JAI6_9BACL|nr:S-layer homology domain-containing protein [Paenibacillus agricola]NHN32296.1 S-layer homology domain-containing protein [Paenibacillus agricola]